MFAADRDGAERDLEAPEAPEILHGEVVSDHEIERRIVTASEFKGPLPPPDVLGEYEAVKPGLADVIVSQWQKETDHRHKTVDTLTATDKEAMREYYGMHRRGQWLGFVVLLGIVGLAVVALILDQAEAAVGGLLLAGGYSITAALRGHRGPPPPPPTDVGEGEASE